VNLSDLPVSALEAEFKLQLPTRHLVVAASTGTGKSTCLPMWAGEQGRVLVVQPRRVACLALADYVAALMGSEVGAEVGFAVRQEQRFNDRTRILFVTPGVALRWYAQDRLNTFSHVMLDEFHERRWDTDLLLAMLRLEGQHRLIVTSATLAAQPLADYLDAGVLRCEGRNFPVTLRYMAREPHHMPAQQDLEQRVKAAVIQAMEETDGDVLVFLPGRGEINRCQSTLRALDAQVLPLHGGIDLRRQNAVLEQGSRRRVILATNVAETSLTLPGITAVVDSGMERRTAQRNGRTVLMLSPVSMASAIQRQGRAGRVGPGLCIRLWGEHAPLEASTPGQIRREALGEMVLAAACAGFTTARLKFFEAPPEKSLAVALQQLRDIGALDARDSATAYGQTLFPLPVDSFFAHLISAMPDDSSREAMVDISAMLSRGVRVRLPADEYGRRDLQAWCPQPCDLLTRIQLLRGLTPDFIDVDETQLAEARAMAQQLREQLSLPPLQDATPAQPVPIADALIRARPSLAFVRRRKRTEALGNGEMEVVVGDQSRFADEAMAALVLDDHSVPGRRGTRQTITVATCMMPVSFAQLAAAGLGTCEDTAPSWDDGSLMVQRERHYAGRVLLTERISPQGPAACEALAALIIRGTLLPGVAARLADDMAAWRLYIALGMAESGARAEEREPVQWLTDRLQVLGVESSDDMALLDADDLSFEGIPDWQREDFDGRWPRQVLLSDLQMDVSYAAGAKVVTLEWRSGTRRKDPARWELPGWSGWKVRYRRASRVIDIR